MFLGLVNWVWKIILGEEFVLKEVWSGKVKFVLLFEDVLVNIIKCIIDKIMYYNVLMRKVENW